MKQLIDSIQEKLVITKDTKEKHINAKFQDYKKCPYNYWPAAVPREEIIKNCPKFWDAAVKFSLDVWGYLGKHNENVEAGIDWIIAIEILDDDECKQYINKWQDQYKDWDPFGESGYDKWYEIYRTNEVVKEIENFKNNK